MPTKKNTELLEKEIFNLRLSIYNDKGNKDQYGQDQIFNYRESYFKKNLSEESFEHLKSGKSKYGSFQLYGSSNIGQYYALNKHNDAFTEERKKNKL